MFDQPFGRPGHFATDDTVGERFECKATDPYGPSLSSLSHEYAFIYPFLPVALYPDSPLDLMTECYHATACPSRYFSRQLPYQAFVLPAAARSLGVPGDMICMVPKGELEAVLNFVRSVVLFDLDKKLNVGIRSQSLSMLDPTLRSEQMIREARLIEVHAFALQYSDGALCFEPSSRDAEECYSEDLRRKFKVPRRYTAGFARQHGDARVGSLTDSFINAYNDPLGYAEQQHGQYDLPVSSVESDSDHGGSNTDDPQDSVD